MNGCFEGELAFTPIGASKLPENLRERVLEAGFTQVRVISEEDCLLQVSCSSPSLPPKEEASGLSDLLPGVRIALKGDMPYWGRTCSIHEVWLNGKPVAQRFVQPPEKDYLSNRVTMAPEWDFPQWVMDEFNADKHGTIRRILGDEASSTELLWKVKDTFPKLTPRQRALLRNSPNYRPHYKPDTNAWHSNLITADLNRLTSALTADEIESHAVSLTYGMTQLEASGIAADILSEAQCPKVIWVDDDYEIAARNLFEDENHIQQAVEYLKTHAHDHLEDVSSGWDLIHSLVDDFTPEDDE